MKKFRRIMALLLATVMVLSMGAVAFADETTTYKITITPNADNDEHTYKAYQIFTGTLDTDEDSPTKGQLTNLGFATGVNGTALLNALKADATIGAKFASAENTAASIAAAMSKCTGTGEPEALAAVIGKYVETAALSEAGTSVDNVISGLPQGYYFVKDVSTGLTKDTKSEYMLQVVGDVTVKAKDSTVTMDKKVDDKNDSNTSEDAIAWQDSADYDIGDTISYRLKGTLPSNYAKFDFFDYEFKDVMCAGLTLNANSVKVVYYANEDAFTADTTATGGTDITDEFKINGSGAGATLSVKIESAFDADGNVTDAGLKSITGITKDSVIVVYYTCVLNDSAEIGATGNDNTAKLTFSNNPNATGNGDNTKSETPEDKNIVFTYKTDIDKVDEKGNALKGADFTLYKEVADSTVTGATQGKDLTFTEGVEHTAIKENSYYVVVGKKTGSAAGSTFEFKGIDDGTYVLVETTVPAGYNAWNSKEFTVTATHDVEADAPKLLTLTGTDPFTNANAGTGAVEVAKEDGTKHSMVSGELYTEIENKSGAQLPSTGGIGTTIFYIIGAILVIGAGVVLVTRRRMSAN